MTLVWSPSMRSTSQPPRPSMVKRTGNMQRLIGGDIAAISSSLACGEVDGGGREFVTPGEELCARGMRTKQCPVCSCPWFPRICIHRCVASAASRGFPNVWPANWSTESAPMTSVVSPDGAAQHSSIESGHSLGFTMRQRQRDIASGSEFGGLVDMAHDDVWFDSD